jgi:hypothetical protein
MTRILLLALSFLGVQQAVSLEGRWTGTSICIERNGPCHDEHVVYYIDRTGPDSAGITPLRLDAKKIINGVEEDMGVLGPCRFTHATNSLYCPMPPNVRPGDWRFTLTGDKLDGGLWVPDGRKFRDVHVRRDLPQDTKK